MLLVIQSPIQEFPRRKSPICDRQIGPKSSRSGGPLIEAHNPYEHMLRKDIDDELRSARTRDIRGFQWTGMGAELDQVLKCLVSWVVG